jgi:Rrf2 family protein
MKFSTRTRYGIRTMLEIGLNYEKGGVLQKDIAANQEISYRTLDHLIHALKTADLITNSNVRTIGYTLTRPPSQITMFDIQRALEPVICVVDCLSIHFECDRSENCTAKGFWSGLNDHIITYFKGVTLQDMVNDQRKRLTSKKF